MKTHRGFTLIELLVALAVMALIAILSWRGLDGMVRAHEQTGQRADEVLAIQTGLAQWTADLDALMQVPQQPVIEWNGRVLRITRRGTASAADGVHVVGWARRNGQWLRWESPALYTRGDVASAWEHADLWAANPSTEQRSREVAIAPLVEWQLFYFRGDSWTNPQSSDAQGTADASGARAGFPPANPQQATSRTPTVPDGVRLVLDLPAGRAIAGRVTRDWINPTVGGGKS